MNCGSRTITTTNRDSSIVTVGAVKFLSNKCMKSETITWVFIGVVIAGYMAQKHAQATLNQLKNPPSAQEEVDPTRWSHNGKQPIEYNDGNRSSNKDVFTAEAELTKALEF